MKQGWSYRAGRRPNSVIVEERVPGGPLYVRVWDSSARNGNGNWIRRSLGHRDRDQAVAYATQHADQLARAIIDRSAFASDT